jgi:hypothetical protein
MAAADCGWRSDPRSGSPTPPWLGRYSFGNNDIAEFDDGATRRPVGETLAIAVDAIARAANDSLSRFRLICQRIGDRQHWRFTLTTDFTNPREKASKKYKPRRHEEHEGFTKKNFEFRAVILSL